MVMTKINIFTYFALQLVLVVIHPQNGSRFDQKVYTMQGCVNGICLFLCVCFC